MGTPEIHGSEMKKLEEIQSEMDDIVVRVGDNYPNLPRDVHFVYKTQQAYYSSSIHIRGAGEAKLFPFNHKDFQIYPVGSEVLDIVQGLSSAPESGSIPLITDPETADSITSASTVVAKDETGNQHHILFSVNQGVRSREILTLTKPRQKPEKPRVDIDKLSK